VSLPLVVWDEDHVRYVNGELFVNDAPYVLVANPSACPGRVHQIADLTFGGRTGSIGRINSTMRRRPSLWLAIVPARGQAD
jgi:hypothetical protein